MKEAETSISIYTNIFSLSNIRLIRNRQSLHCAWPLIGYFVVCVNDLAKRVPSAVRPSS